MAGEFPFQDLENIIHKHREKLLNTMTDQYMLAKAARLDPGSEEVQRKIYDAFCQEVPDDEIEILRNKFYPLHTQRDKNLKQYVNDDITNYFKGLKGNEDLVKAHYLETTARDRVTGEVLINTVSVTGYHSERNIDSVLKKSPYDILPEFRRANGELASVEDIEILSIVNITGLYDIKDAVKGEEFDSLKYKIASRVKNSERELKKAMDWFMALRDKDDYPYDAIAVRVSIMPKKEPDGTVSPEQTREIAEQMYAFKDYITNISRKYGKVIPKNVNTLEENIEIDEKLKAYLKLKHKTKDKESELKAKKLCKDKYDPDNFREIMLGMKTMHALLNKKKENDSGYLPTRYEIEHLLQYVQLKHYMYDDRVETQIMTDEMEYHYKGKHAGHTKGYIIERDKEREEYLDDPSKSDARKNMRKREKRTLKNKNRNNTKEMHLERLIELFDGSTDSSPKKEPSVRLLAELLENRYRVAFMRPEYDVVEY